MERVSSGNQAPLAFQHYVALGDSMSIDLYPSLDLRSRYQMHLLEDVGAATLLHCNADWLWPAFQGLDLRSLCPGIRHSNLTMDGATTAGVLEYQLPAMPKSDGGPALITLTVGGNDLLRMMFDDAKQGRRELPLLIERLRRIVDGILASYDDALLLVGTVYDPSDGQMHLGDGVVLPDGFAWLTEYNDAVRRLAERERCRVADIHRHFFGHGLATEASAERWYWEVSIIEPGALGASEVRRVWLDCLGVRSAPEAGSAAEADAVTRRHTVGSRAKRGYGREDP